MVEAYYSKYGWKEDPFTLAPAPELIVGVKNPKELIIRNINNHDVTFVNGVVGSGKTTLLKWLELYGLKDFLPIFISGLDQRFNNDQLDNLIKEKKGFWDRFLRKSKKIVLLVDEIQLLDKTFNEYIKLLWDNKTISSVVFASPELFETINSLTDSFKDRIGNNKLILEPLTSEECHQLIKKRLKDLKNPFNEDVLKIIFEESNYFPRRILQNCKAVLQELDVINDANVKKLLRKEDIKPTLPIEEIKETMKITSTTEILSKLSPLEKDIISLLAVSPMTRKQLSSSLGKSEFSVGNQLSRLMLQDEGKRLENKGFSEPIVEKITDVKPALFNLTPKIKQIFAKE